MDSPEMAPVGTAPVAVVKPALRDRRGLVYTPAIGPKLKYLLAFLFVGVAILGATGIYLFALSALQWLRGPKYTTSFSLWMTLAHIAVGIIIVAPFFFFGFLHLLTAYNRPNRRAVRLGISLFIMGTLATLSGLALVQLHDKLQLPTGSPGRAIAYLLHVITPVIAVVLYVLHRRAGPDLQWKWGAAWGGGVVVFTGAMYFMHSFNPHNWDAVGSKDGLAYFQPSAALTADGKFIKEDILMMDEYCKKCHADIYNDHLHSAHRFSSFNNKPYLFSVRETRKVSLERDGNMKGARWCAGCHDVVPFFSGKFDDPNYDDVNDPTSQAGITCTACHAINHINSTDGNGAYTIEEPQHYPFAQSTNPFLQWVNNQMVKAKPDFHKQTFLKPVHRSTEFCSTCHKVSIPMELNHYKDFLRGQNHHDPFLQSGFGGENARSFYYPPAAKNRCADCHMPLEASDDFGTHDFDNSGIRKRHSHMFPGANTGLPFLLSLDPKKQEQADAFRKRVDYQAEFLKDKKVRIDVFGVREGDSIDAKLTAPLRPKLPNLKPGQTYLVEVVVRTLAVGHLFSQGTVDSNEIWVDFEAKSGGKVFGRNGGLSGPDDSGTVDEYSHFINVLMLDRNGNRINRRNPQDIFTPLYNHQIPPGAASVLHYKLDVPADIKDPVEIKVRVRYRKFDFEYMALVHEGADKAPNLPIVDMCADSITLPVEGGNAKAPDQTSPIDPPWQRWNDYGIGMFLTASSDDKRPGILQAEEAFRKLTTLDAKPAQMHGYLNLARSYVLEGGAAKLDKAKEALDRIHDLQIEDKDLPWWTVAWFSGVVDAQNGHLDEAIQQFEKILDPSVQRKDRNFDFTKDYVVLDEAGKTLFKRAQPLVDPEDKPERDKLLSRAIGHLERTLSLEREDVDAHYWLNQSYRLLGEDAPLKAEGTAPIDGDELKELAQVFTDGKQSLDRRLEAAGQVSRGILKVGEQPAKPGVPRPAITKALLEACRPVFQGESDARLKSAAAQVLANVHQVAHGLYKPDEGAANTSLNIYRKVHPAAAAASQAVVVYPTDRLKPQKTVKNE